MTDPSGENPIVAAALLGGTISGGINIAAQLITMQPQSLSQVLRCMDWGQAGIAFAAGAVAGITGFGIFGGVTAVFGTGMLSNVAAGALAGVVSGQYARLTELVLSGHTDQIKSTLFQPKDLVLDLVLGGIGGGIDFKIRHWGGSNPKIVNNKGVPYPEVEIPGYGNVPFPGSPFSPNNTSSRATEFTPTFKKGFQIWWKNQGLPWPEDEVHLHHIKPLRFGGEYTFENLVPLTRPQHDLFTNWWRNFEYFNEN